MIRYITCQDDLTIRRREVEPCGAYNVTWREGDVMQVARDACSYQQPHATYEDARRFLIKRAALARDEARQQLAQAETALLLARAIPKAEQ